ncbi:MAG TPA: LemA family protein [Caulobacteraceae bacterium]|jgi:LemA protein
MAAVVAASVSLAGCGVNTIPTKSQQAQAAWADVQAQYQRRSDLIPNLVATVQGYANQERSVLVDVTNARANATSVKIDASNLSDPAAFQRFEQAQNQLSGVLGRLLVANERYPELKSNENFLALQSQIEGTENRIEVARKDYNQAALSYNTELVTFPGVLWKGTMYSSYKPMNLFSASGQAQNAPTVNFNIAPPGGQGAASSTSSSAPASTPGGGAPPPSAAAAPGSAPSK